MKSYMDESFLVQHKNQYSILTKKLSHTVGGKVGLDPKYEL